MIKVKTYHLVLEQSDVRHIISLDHGYISDTS